MLVHLRLTIQIVVTFVMLPAVTGAKEPSPVRERRIADSDREHWAYRPLRRPVLPSVTLSPVENPIDRFIQARLQASGLVPFPLASRLTLIRRATFDLTGLPPTAKEVNGFLQDRSPSAYERLIDRLMASPRYGEHQGQLWLDLARFAETDGFEHDKTRKDAWRYRDWVISAFNRDLPYNDFLTLQIAGDETAPDSNGTHVATGFLMSGPDMPDINLPAERKHVLLNEMTSTVGSVFLGLTLECAQCHNHKFDPLSQADFYRFRAFFANTLANLKKNHSHAMTIKEPGRDAPKAHLMIRGDFRRPGPVVPPAFLRIVNSENQVVPKPSSEAKSSLRRTALAQWLTNPRHPLTARVIVNRVWQHYFGRGLSTTPSDFGALGGPPSHSRLLDWLATELIQQKWSLKKLHRLILTSRTYRQASRPTSSSWSKTLQQQAQEQWLKAKAKDPDNALLWRMNRKRLKGEAIRDAILACANELHFQPGGPGVMAPLPKELIETLLPNQWTVTRDRSQHYRRSIYIFARRNLRYPIFEAFDRPDGNASCPRRSQSTTAPQALMLFNSKLTHEMAQAIARSVTGATTETLQQMRLCYQKILSRPPTSKELAIASQFIKEDQGNGTALQDLCLALININEFIYID